MASAPLREAARQTLTMLAPSNPAYLSLRVEGEITDAMANRITRRLAASPNVSTLSIIINSPGGDLRAARRIYDAIRRHPAKRKLAHGIGQVASAAALIFAAADVRRLAADTQVLLHAVAMAPSEHAARWTRAQYESHAATLAALDDSVAAILAERTGAPLSVIKAELATERPMPLAKALSIGIAHEVVGISRPLTKAWPATAHAAMARVNRYTFGADGHRFSDQYITACAIGGR